MTVEALAQVMCLVSGIFGRPAWDEPKCLERAGHVLEAARRHAVDPLLMVALEVQECDMRDSDAPIYKVVGGRRRLAGYDACPMGVRIMGVSQRQRHDAASLYELAAARLERWRKWCRRGHPGGRYPGHLPAGHHHVAHYNQGNPRYADQVLAIKDALEGGIARPGRAGDLTPRTREIVKRIHRAIARADENKAGRRSP